ncbi:MAG: adenine deaminase [Syntrophales bacterium]|nr:adenine deaminase [Syntrophales bacterium]
MTLESIRTVSGRIVDVVNRRIFNGSIKISNGRITDVLEEDVSGHRFILPGFIDAHIHIESSMLVPYEFARMALRHGTVATVSDPHEIANVLGMRGIDYMAESGKEALLKFHFGAPSCVPATPFETAGAVLGVSAVDKLLKRDDIYFLSEMMNYPGVLNRDTEVMEKISRAIRLGKPVDGHAPGLKGDGAAAYIEAGISTDHECFTLEEAIAKANLGMRILIREGSAARNFDALHPLLESYPLQVMFCCDDLHPDELLHHHIDDHVRRAVALGYDLFDVLWAASVNPVLHYDLAVGLLQPGDPADMILVDNLVDFRVERTILDGMVAARDGRCLIPERSHSAPNNFKAKRKKPEDFSVKALGDYIRVIEAINGQVITGEIKEKARVVRGNLAADPDRDLLKIALVNRYADSPPAVGFVKNFGIRKGALASSVAHDSHNIVAVGTDDGLLCRAVNLVIENSGGLSLVNGDEERVISLPVAGLMSVLDGETIGHSYAEIEAGARTMGSRLRSPYMTLSFMSLLVIPRLKLSDRGLFDGESFKFTSLAY